MRSDLRDFKAIFPIFPFLFESILVLFEASTITITPFSNLPPKQELSSYFDSFRIVLLFLGRRMLWIAFGESWRETTHSLCWVFCGHWAMLDAVKHWKTDGGVGCRRWFWLNGSIADCANWRWSMSRNAFSRIENRERSDSWSYFWRLDAEATSHYSHAVWRKWIAKEGNKGSNC